MDVSTTIKTQLKAQRLELLQRRYYELELDKTAYEATEDLEAVKVTTERMENVQKAYAAVNALQTGE